MSSEISTGHEAQKHQATITIPQQNGEMIEYQLPVMWDVHNNAYLMTTSLYAETGVSLLDEGLRSTAVSESKITRITASVSKKDSIPRGVLQYRGYNVKQLSTSCTFLEATYLLLYGDLPNQEQFKQFSDDIRSHRIIDKQTEDIINTFDRQSNPMTVLMTAVSSLATRYEQNYDMHKSEDRYQMAIRIIAKMPSLAACIYKHIVGQRIIEPEEDLGHTANFLHMLLSTQAKTASPDPKHIKILDMILTLHADHQMAVSTFVARAVSSAGSPSFTSISAALAALSGPLHGGANIKVVEMLEEITDENIDDVLKKAKDHDDPFKLYGFGHRVYRGMDPRAAILRELTLKIVSEQKNAEEPNPIYEKALLLEEKALEDPYFKERNLYPNVDFYSGLALTAIGVPKELFTIIFAISRTSGWLAHIEEGWENKAALFRPKQYYTGLKERPLDWP